MRTLKELERRLKRKVSALWNGAHVPHTVPLPIREDGGREEKAETDI